MDDEKTAESENSTETMSRVIYWIGNTVYIPCVVKRYSKYIHKLITVDFDSIGVNRGGLLENLIVQLQFPAHYKRAKKFFVELEYLLVDEKIKTTLSSQTHQLEPQQIFHIFSSHDQYLSKLQIKYKGNRGSHFRVYFHIVEVLKNGNLIKELGYKSIHKDFHKYDYKDSLLSEKIDPGEIDKELRAPISLINFSSLDELENKAKSHLQNRIKRLEDACWDIVKSHKKIVEQHNLYKSQPLPPELSLRLNSNLPSKFLHEYYQEHNNKNSILHFLLHYVELHKLYISNAWKISIGGSIIPDASFYEINCVKNPRSKGTLLASYFVPNLVLIACQYLIQIYSKGWNPDSVRSLTFKDLEYLEDIKAYKLNGFKSKTDQNLTPLIFDNPDSRPFQVLQILEDHNRNLNRYCVREGSFLLAGYCQVHRHYGLFNPKAEHYGIVKRYQLQDFKPSAIRDQVINAEYLISNKDIRYVKELLGHGDLGTVDVYLNHHIQKILNEANINQYMRQLSESIIWAVSSSEFEKSNSTETNPAKKLLFPVGEKNNDASYICDSWDQTFDAIEIGIEEINHCFYQFQYYKNNFQQLKTSNSERFSKIHLPRILFSIALNQVIAESKFGFILRNLEKNPKSLYGVSYGVS